MTAEMLIPLRDITLLSFNAADDGFFIIICHCFLILTRVLPLRRIKTPALPTCPPTNDFSNGFQTDTMIQDTG